MILDVGCGWNPQGDVNTDLFLHRAIPERSGEQRVYFEYKKKLDRVQQIPNFLCCDVNFLPFRNSIFDDVICYHLLEHKGVNFTRACRELLRVTQNKLYLSVPSAFATFSRFGGHELHDKRLSKDCFHRVFANHRREIKYARWHWRFVLFPFKPLTFIAFRIPDFIPCPIPTEIKVQVMK